MTTFNDVRASVLNAAAALDDEKLTATLKDVEASWEMIEAVSGDENYLPTVLKENNSKNNRTNVFTMKANLARRKQLAGWIENEQQLGGCYGELYGSIYKSELELLDAYALSTVLALYEEDGTILNYIETVKAKAESAKKENRKEGAKKGAAKRKETMAKRKREFEEAQEAKRILEALIAQGNVDLSALDLKEPAEGETGANPAAA